MFEHMCSIHVPFTIHTHSMMNYYRLSSYFILVFSAFILTSARQTSVPVVQSTCCFTWQKRCLCRSECLKRNISTLQMCFVHGWPIFSKYRFTNILWTHALLQHMLIKSSLFAVAENFNISLFLIALHCIKYSSHSKQNTRSIFQMLYAFMYCTLGCVEK